MKQGQLTLFIILGVIILFFLFFFYLNSYHVQTQPTHDKMLEVILSDQENSTGAAISPSPGDHMCRHEKDLIIGEIEHFFFGSQKDSIELRSIDQAKGIFYYRINGASEQKKTHEMFTLADQKAYFSTEITNGARLCSELEFLESQAITLSDSSCHQVSMERTITIPINGKNYDVKTYEITSERKAKFYIQEGTYSSTSTLGRGESNKIFGELLFLSVTDVSSEVHFCLETFS